jgi:hypothetical protein
LRLSTSKNVADAVLDRFVRALDLAPAGIPHDVEAKAALYRTVLTGRRVLILLDNTATVGQVRPCCPAQPACRWRCGSPLSERPVGHRCHWPT